MTEDEIPDVIREIWPELRPIFQLQSMKMLADLSAEEDYGTLGMYAVANEKLLQRIDSIMAVIPHISQPRRAQRLGQTPPTP